MWQCLKCREKIEDSFDVCWRCGTSKEGVADPQFQTEQTGDAGEAPAKGVAGGGAAAPTAGAFAAAPPDGAEMGHWIARGLVLVLRCLALLAAVWGVIHIADAVEVYRAALEAIKQARANQVGAERLAQEAESAAAKAVFTAVITVVAVVAVLLALAEGLRLAVLIEWNTRKTGQLQERAKGKRRAR
jgi:hypothetical protein